MRTYLVKLTLLGKVFLAVTALTLAVAWSSEAVLYCQASRALRGQVRSHLEAIASTVANQIDPSTHASITSRADEKGASYSRVRSILRSAAEADSSVYFIYTMRPTRNPNKWMFVVDAEANPADASHVGDVYDASEVPAMRDALRGPSADAEPTSDEWGTYLSGYAPIHDSRGRPDGIVGVDMSLAHLRKEEWGLRRSALVCTLLSLLLACGVALTMTRRTGAVVSRFTDAAHRVRSGDLEFSMPVQGCHEIQEFATAFNGMIAGLLESRERLVEGSSRDFLTGLYNHMYMHERLEMELQRARRHGYSVCVLMMDLDRFKSVNDTLGHPIGDSMLRQLGWLLRSGLREADVPVRYGGDEFAVILPRTSASEGAEIAERLRVSVESHVFYAVPVSDLSMDGGSDMAGKEMRASVTIGLAAYPEHHESKDGLIMAADIALCQAKHLSRNRVGVYDPGLPTESVDPSVLYHMLHDPNGPAVASLAAALDAKDHYMCGHSERVAKYAQHIARAIHADDRVVDTLWIAGLLHDVGKIGVSDAILNKAGSLSVDERETMMRHASLGAEILKRAPQLDQVIPAVAHHHERWDGAGYPDGLAGHDIPITARMMAIADAFDAMTSDRPYRKAMPTVAAIAELRACAGTQFDPDLVEAFLGSVTEEMRSAA